MGYVHAHTCALGGGPRFFFFGSWVGGVFFFCREGAGYAHAHARTPWVGGRPLLSVFFFPLLKEYGGRPFLFAHAPCPMPTPVRPTCAHAHANAHPLLPIFFLSKGPLLPSSFPFLEVGVAPPTARIVFSQGGGGLCPCSCPYALAWWPPPPVRFFFLAKRVWRAYYPLAYAHANARAA